MCCEECPEITSNNKTNKGSGIIFQAEIRWIPIKTTNNDPQPIPHPNYKTSMISSFLNQPLLPSSSNDNDKTIIAKQDVLVQASMPASMFNLANAIVGAGVLTLPFAIKSTGVLLGLGLLFLFALLSSYSLLLLGTYWRHYYRYAIIILTRSRQSLVADAGCRMTGARTYAELGRVVHGVDSKAGDRIEYAVEALQSLYSYGACVGYLQIVVSELVVVTGYSGRLLLLLGCLCVVFPLSLMKNLQSLSFTSLCAICCVAYLSIVIVIRYEDGGDGGFEECR